MKKRISYLILVVGLMPSLAWAQQIPSAAQAGAVAQELQQEIPKMTFEKKVPIIDVKLPEQELNLKEGIQFPVTHIEIIGNTVVKTVVLEHVVRPFEGKTMGLAELRQMTDLITEEYRKRGFFLAKTYLPAQEVTSGNIKVNILEGKLGQLLLKGNKHYSDKFLRNHFKATDKGVIQYGRLLKTLSLFNELPGLNTRAVFQTGKTVGTVDLLLVVQDYGRMLSYSFDYNNFGSRFVSRYRFGSNAEFGNLIFQGDNLSLHGVLGTPFSGLRYGQFAYWIPVGGYGTKVGISAMGTRYLAGRELRYTDTKGSSYIYTISIKQPVMRTRTVSVDVELDADYKQFDNYQSPATHSKDYLRTLRQSISLDWLDPWKGRTFTAFEMTTGLDLFGASPQDDPTMSRPGGDGKFVKFDVHFSRVQKLPYQALLLFRGIAQFSPSKLSTAEQLSLGGADSVRGYPQSEYLGDQGYNINTELYFAPPLVGNLKLPWLNKQVNQMVQGVLFFDNGVAFYRKNSDGIRNHQMMSGFGPGVRFSLPFDTSLRIDWGIPIGSPSPTDGASSAFYIQVSNSLIKFPPAPKE